MPDVFYEYYLRKDVQEAIARSCDNREVAPRYNEGFGKRPDVVQYPGDVLEFARKGATSFHVSEERWSDPLTLKPGMSKKELDERRVGWDLLLDIDVTVWDYAKWTGYFLVEALKFHDVKNISVKFSGSKGFHLGVPFESFPREVNGIPIKDQFPGGPKIITAYLQNMIRSALAQKILEHDNATTIVEKTGKKKSDLYKNGEFDPFAVIDIDTVLISNRHLFRAPYSLHEKTRLVSLPINKNQVLAFEKAEAEPENVKPSRGFLEPIEIGDAKQLVIQAFDWWAKRHEKRGPDTGPTKKQEFALPSTAIQEQYFPQCIQRILAGMGDGKKRSLFILIQFLRHMNWAWGDIEARVKAWNNGNTPPLSQTYTLGQLSWHKRQGTAVLPPNCANKAYYQDLRIMCANNICARYKNPVNVALAAARHATEPKPSS